MYNNVLVLRSIDTHCKKIMNMSRLLFIFLFFVPLLSFAQTTEQTDEAKVRAETDELISKSLDAIRTDYMALDISDALKGVDQIEKLYLSGKSSLNNDFKYEIKLARAQLYAMNGNSDEALHLLGELKEEKPEYMKRALYDCAFASLQSKPEFIRITSGNPLELFFALVTSVSDSINQSFNTNRFDDVFKYLDIADSLFNDLPLNDRIKATFVHVQIMYVRAMVYSMKGNVGEAMRLLKEIKANGWDYAINSTIDDNGFNNLKQVKEYKTLISGMKCNCREVFNWAATEFEKNDAGFDYAIETKGKEAYEKITAEKQSKSKKITSPPDCVKLVNEWLNFFRKSHIGFFLNSPSYADQINIYDKFAVKRLSKNTIYIKIKSFGGSEIQQIISDMIDANDYLLSNTPNLIIDLRGNGGGWYNSWNPLRKYINSKPVYSSDNMIIRVSEENARQLNIANLVRDNAGKRFAGDASLTIKNPDVVKKFPKSIVILIDNSTASSSESFLIYAKQSNKVKVMGQKTSGTTEVGSVIYLESPDKQFKLFYGMGIMPQAKYTQYLDYGIQPDIFLPNNFDWIEEARKYLEYE